MDQNFRRIQTIRRLIRVGRYNEAYILLKETNHPQVPALERRLSHFREQCEMESLPTLPVMPRCTLVTGGVVGVVLALIFRAAPINELFMTSAGFGLGFLIGIAADYTRRRDAIRNMQEYSIPGIRRANYRPRWPW